MERREYLALEEVIYQGRQAGYAITFKVKLNQDSLRPFEWSIYDRSKWLGFGHGRIHECAKAMEDTLRSQPRFVEMWGTYVIR